MNLFVLVSVHDLFLVTLPSAFTNNCEELILALLYLVRRDSSVDIATGYELDGVGIVSRWWRDFPHLSRTALGPTQVPVQWVSVFSPAVKQPERDLDQPPSSADVKKRVKLYFYSPSGLRGLL